ncbi:GNAT family N-acetyltransferase [Microvirga roseola]|uniref:GNAT family N-acetyltransferase n=1 Tax=Microvirga roseola TaxID=2883126 RepID=UPI001E29B343|nr:GNAT family N-acetyltransferase [Microvirga roseola]
MREHLIIRPYREADWSAIAEAHDQAREQELRLSVGVHAFRSLAETADSEGLFAGELWVAEIKGGVAGFVAIDTPEITWLYVHPERQRAGIGRLLLRHAVSRINGRVLISALDGNVPALQLYASEGFLIKETKDGHLQGDEGVMARGHLLELLPTR